VRAPNALRLLLIVLAGTLALPLVVSLLVLRGPAPVSRAADGDPAVIATIPVGSGPSDVAVNPNTDRIYVANSGSDTLSVIDGATNSVLTNVPMTRPYGVAANPATDRI